MGVKLIAEGSEEQGTGGLERFVPEPRRAPERRRDPRRRHRQLRRRRPHAHDEPAGTGQRRRERQHAENAMHSGMFGGPAPDALLALDPACSRPCATPPATRRSKASLSDANWTRRGVSPRAVPRRCARARRRRAARLRRRVQDMLWSRPAVTVLGIDCPPVVGSAAAVPAQARARVSLRVPPGIDAKEAQDTLDRPPARRHALARQGADRAGRRRSSRSRRERWPRIRGHEQRARSRPSAGPPPRRSGRARSPCATSCTTRSRTPRSCLSASRSHVA